MMASRAEKRAFWVRHVEASAASGLGRLAYCEAHGLKPGTLDVWRRRLREDRGVAFVPIQRRGGDSYARIELHIGSLRLTFPAGTDATWVAALLRALG
jgi:transposase-like protein